MDKKKVVESVPGQVSGWMDVKAVLRIAQSNGKMCYQNIQKQKFLPAKKTADGRFVSLDLPGFNCSLINPL